MSALGQSGHFAIHSITLSASSKNDLVVLLHVPPSGPRDPFLERTQCCASLRTKVPTWVPMRAHRSPKPTRCRSSSIGRSPRVTIELKEMKKADRDDAEQARKAAVLKKGLAD